jgi:hypothetical protein
MAAKENIDLFFMVVPFSFGSKGIK